MIMRVVDAVAIVGAVSAGRPALGHRDIADVERASGLAARRLLDLTGVRPQDELDFPIIPELGSLVPPYIAAEELAAPEGSAVGGGDFFAATATECVEACSQLPSCNAASWRRISNGTANCFLKQLVPACQIPVPVELDRSAFLFIQTPTTCAAQNPPDVALLAELDPPYVLVNATINAHPNHPSDETSGVEDLDFTRNATAADCAAQCSSTPRCNAASWLGSNTAFYYRGFNCFLKRIDPGCAVPASQFPMPMTYLILRAPDFCPANSSVAVAISSGTTVPAGNATSAVPTSAAATDSGADSAATTDAALPEAVDGSSMADRSSGTAPTAAIVAASVGGSVLVAAILALAVFYMRRRARKAASPAAAPLSAAGAKKGGQMMPGSPRGPPGTAPPPPPGPPPPLPPGPLPPQPTALPASWGSPGSGGGPVGAAAGANRATLMLGSAAATSSYASVNLEALLTARSSARAQQRGSAATLTGGTLLAQQLLQQQGQRSVTTATGTLNSFTSGPNAPLEGSEEVDALEAELDALRASQSLFMGRYNVLGATARRLGGQSLVQFATQQVTPSAVALKFFFERAAYDVELALYNDAGLAKIMPRCLARYANADGSLRGRDGYRFPPVLAIERGESLDEFAARVERDPITVIQALVHIVSRVRALHGMGVVHRDLKPGNILRMPDAHAWALIDFGFAAYDGTTAPLALSLKYAPPEVVVAYRAGDTTITASKAADMWSVGAIAYHLLTGELWPEGATTASVAAALAGDAPLPWEAAPAATLKSLLRLKGPILECLDRDAARRPSASDLAAVINTIFLSATATAPAVSE